MTQKTKKKKSSNKDKQGFLKRLFSIRNDEGKISIWKVFMRLTILVILLFIVTGIIAFIVAPDVEWLKFKNPSTTAMIKERNEYYKENNKPTVKIRRWVQYKHLPQNFKYAVRIAEDDAFFQHNGFDFSQVWESAKSVFSKKGSLRGASTITQQVAKNLFFSERRSLLRKVLEVPIVIKLEKNLSKKRIFEIYVNIIEYGDGIYGIESASRFYFGKHASDLDLDQSIFLAAIIKRPRYFQEHRSSKSFVYRQDIILERMAGYGYIK
ncbi:MAG: monofunctional biosynthetic peptidoglycan transglycosylase [Acidobacteria bacterium]|nr:monofunctional biosynthetic peptidoglycan transglycosylase [Acidobacteriota bacterium]